MTFRISALVFAFLLLWYLSPISYAFGNDECRNNQLPAISFVEIQSLDMQNQPPSPLTVKGKLILPVRFEKKQNCLRAMKNIPAVVILHGSAGIDFRGDFYARALNDVGIATLEIDMWEARGVTGGEDRPPVPLFTYPDAFAALAFLSQHPNINPNRIGVLGFSWGGVMSMASATKLYAAKFGGGLKFAAHVAHYPVCWAHNNPHIPGSEFSSLTGAPVLIQIGEKDDYDQGSAPCFDLVAGLAPEDKRVVRVTEYEDAFHGWDRLQVPITVDDSFSHLGAGGEVEIVPNVQQAYRSRNRVVGFFRNNL